MRADVLYKGECGDTFCGIRVFFLQTAIQFSKNRPVVLFHVRRETSFTDNFGSVVARASEASGSPFRALAREFVSSYA